MAMATVSTMSINIIDVHVARKAVVINVSDLAVKGVQLIALLASIGIPKGLSKKDIQQIGKGLNDGTGATNNSHPTLQLGA